MELQSTASRDGVPQEKASRIESVSAGRFSWLDLADAPVVGARVRVLWLVLFRSKRFPDSSLNRLRLCASFLGNPGGKKDRVRRARPQTFYGVEKTNRAGRI